MIKVWMLVVMLGDGFTMVPLDTEVNCTIALSTVAATAESAYCYEIEQIIPQKAGPAPELSPMPRPKPPKKGQSV